MNKFAEIAVNISGIEGVFDYAIPADLETCLQPGCLVEVPYNKIKAQGVIVRVKTSSAFAGDIKAIISLIEDMPVIPPAYLDVAAALADQYHQPIASFLKAMLPVGLSRQPYTLYTANVPDEADLTKLPRLQVRLLDLLNTRGPQRSTQLDYVLSRFDWRKAARKLVKKEWVIAKSILPAPKIVAKKVSTVALHPDFDKENLDQLVVGNKGGNAANRKLKALHVLKKEAAPVLVSYLYAASNVTYADIRFLEKKGFVITGKREVFRDPVVGMQPEGTQKPRLTREQEDAWRLVQIELEKQEPTPVLLRGITGSGKTELYMLAAEKVASAGKQAVILVPEISLTPQTIQRFLDRFPDKVGVIHSRLSDGERYDTWRRAQKRELDVLIGPRSALLTPLPSLGLIVLDECHDDSYYQQGQSPSYHSQEAALVLVKNTGAAVILGSATPNVTQFFSAKQKKWPIIHLDKRIAASVGKTHPKTPYTPLPKVDVIDMRAELRAGNASIFSRDLQKALKTVVQAGQQAILFLNRRGNTTIIFCRDCGYTAKCSRCDFPLTHHTNTDKLICHTCGYSRGMITVCPECKGQRIRQYGMGTERVERALKELIPGCRVLRWDARCGSRSEQ